MTLPMSQWSHTLNVFETGRDRGLHYGLQLWVSHRGMTVADLAWGEAFPGCPLTTDDWLPWLSAGKPLTAVAIAQLVEQGRCQWDSRVCEFIPEFAAGGKEAITIQHLLTHTAGLRQVDYGWPECDWEESVRRVCAAILDPGAIPGETPGYHVASTWFILGEILQRCDGQPIVEILANRIFTPSGMTETRLALSPEEQANLGNRLAPMYERTPEGLKPLDWHQPPRVSRPSPGSSVCGPIRDLTKFYDMLRQQGQGMNGRVLQPTTVAEITRRHRIGQFDLTFQHKVDFGLGFVIDSNTYGAATVPYGYGKYASPDTFGHGGAQSSQGFYDPQRDLIVAYVFNGRPGEPQHNRRCRQLNEAIYEDLGLTA
ncbi:serine hydrolase [bacterium]|nr:serine hydrolase [bacterium]